jgi:hypothetical protein
MKKNEGKPGKYVYLRDRMEKWNDRLWAIFDLSYLAVAGAGFLFARLATLVRPPVRNTKDDRK